MSNGLAGYVLKVSRMPLTYRDKFALTYLAAAGGWHKTRDILVAVNSSHTADSYKTSFLCGLVGRGLIDREGNRARGYRYRAVLR